MVVQDCQHITLTMLSRTLVCLLLSGTAVFAASPPRSLASPVVFASSVGAHLDSSLLKGGGTDDTAILQGVLDRASNGKPIELIVDGPALISGLNVYGNTIISCLNGGGFFLKDRSSRAIIRNAHRSRDAISDERITLRGCFLNGNRWQQPGFRSTRPPVAGYDQRAVDARNKEPDGTYITGLQFLGVNDLTLEHLTIWSTRAFGALVANGQRISIRDINVDDGGGPDADIDSYGNTDALHFKGPLRNVSIAGVRVHVGDDAIALNADDYDTDDLTKQNDFGPYVRSGPITDVTVNDLQLIDTRNGVRLLSSQHRIDRITISNVSGTVRGYHVIEIGHWTNPKGFGNIGTVAFDNVVVDWPMDTIVGAATPFLHINVHADALLFHNIATTVHDTRPIMQLGQDAEVKLIAADLHLLDPRQLAVPIALDAGARVDAMSLLLDWQGAANNGKRSPITDRGGKIGELRWMDGSRNF